MKTKSPGAKLCVALIPTVLPIPNCPPPDTTVTYSAVGCQCSGTRYPSGKLSRSTNLPAADGSPGRTLILPPGGKPGGAKSLQGRALPFLAVKVDASFGAAAGAGMVLSGAASA